MTTMDHFDPFATAGDVQTLITGGRYRLPDLTIGQEGQLITEDRPRPYGWQRVTTLVKAIAEARMLDLWHQRQIIRGLVMREDLYDLACATDLEDRDKLNALASQILAAAGATFGANTGTALHGFMEAEEQGITHYARKKWRPKIDNYISTRDAHRLEFVPEWTERIVVNLKYGTAGTFDRVYLDQIIGAYLIADGKSQKAFWSWNEISAQLANYAGADAMWDRGTCRYVDPPPVSQDVGVALWFPAVVEPEDDPDRVEIFNVDLARGREWLDIALQVDRMRATGRSKRQTIATLRPLPALGQVESYAARLQCVASLSEGSALWAEIVTCGMGDVPELRQAATDAVNQLTTTLAAG